MATKVGEGYIEIKPRLIGFNRDLLRDARRRIRDLEAASKEAIASIAVKPRITGITKAWQREVQQELNAKITGLTVDVTVRLENQALKATFNDFTVEAKKAGEKASQDLSTGFKRYIGDVHREINKANIAVKSGFKAPDDSEIRQTIDSLGQEFQELSEDIEKFSNQEVRSINQAVNSHKVLNNLLDRETKKSVSEYEKSIEQAIRATDKMVANIMGRRPKEGLTDHSGVWNLAKSLNDEIDDMNALIFQAFPDLDRRLAEQAKKSGGNFSNAFSRALRTNFFDNVSETILSLGGQFGFFTIASQALFTSLSNLAAGMVNLSTIAVDLYGSFLALPGVWAAVAQAGTVLTFAFQGIQDALTAVMNEQQHTAANAAVKARQVAAAQEQIADAKERLQRAVEAANDGIARAEESLANAAASAAKRIESAQEAVAEAHASAAEAVQRANDRIEDAQQALARTYESAADRIASAEKRHADAIKRVRDAQQGLNDAYREALERFEDLNIALGNAVLDEEGAKLAIERAKQRLDETFADTSATDLDKREADLAYREALQRLADIQEKNADLRKEIEEANKTGVEGSKEVTDAKQKIVDAQQAEIEAQQEVAKAHEEAAESIADAQKRVTEAHAEAARAQIDSAKRIQEAEDALAEARAEGAKSVQDAQKDLAKAHEASARAIADAQKGVARSIDNLTEVQEKQNEQWFNTQYAMSLLAPEAQKFVRYLADTFIPRMREVQFSIQQAFFPPIQEGLSQSGALIDLFQTKLTVTAGIFGELIGKTLEWLNTPETVNSLGTILDTNNRLFNLLGEAGLNFGDALLVIAEESGPFLESMAKLVLDFSKWISDITNSQDGREELRTFFENVRETIQKVYDIAKLVGTALYEVYKMARPFGQDFLDDIKDIAKEFNEWVNSVEGKTEIEKFLENGRDFLKEVLQLAKDVAKAFFEFGADGNLSGVIKSLREDLLPAILRLMDAFGGGNSGGGFIFLIKTVSLAVDALSGSISLLAALVSGIGALFTGDWSGARASFADFLDSVRGSAMTVFGEALPESFRQSSQAFNDSVRGMEDDQGRVSLNYGKLTNDTNTWSTTTAEATGRVKLDYSTMADDVAINTDRYATDVDGKTKDAKVKAEQNSQQTREAILFQMEQMRLENAVKLDQYRATVDNKTREAKDASNRNVGDIVRDATTLLIPFSGVFFKAGEEAQKAISNPGASWWDVGASIINGLWEGVKGLIPNLITSIWNLGVDIVNTIRRALDSNSPSRKMMNVGKDVGEGLSIGIESMTGKVGRASQRLASTVMDSFGDPSLSVEVGSTGGKVVPTIGAAGISGVTGGPRNVNYITVNAAPTIPTEKQISNVLKYQDALYQ